MVKLDFDLYYWLLPIATALGAFRGFPEPPVFFKELSKNELFQYLMLFTLIWQGGGRQDVAVSGVITIGIFIINKLLSGAISFGSADTTGAAPPAPAPPAAPAAPAPAAPAAPTGSK